MTKKFAVLSVAVLGLLYAFPADANAVTLFNFEGTASGASISQSVDGITATVTKADASNIDVTGALGPASWGNNSLLAFDSGADLIINFSVAVTNVSIEWGDFNQDTDENTMQAYAGANGTGALLGSQTVFIPGTLNIADGDVGTADLAVDAAGILSVRLSSPLSANNPFPMSIFWDNLRVNTQTTPTPEPATVLLLGAGLLGLAVTASRKNRG
jgi:hypothetical protein